jgi:hypothetical protein
MKETKKCAFPKRKGEKPPFVFEIEKTEFLVSFQNEKNKRRI